ncbi:MAG TPA: tetratricopeptide repeat protein, partial [Kofleriaceae bacterium]|nr:tetratricopeptide repeat protein [Kofleriaceae bacterium]
MWFRRSPHAVTAIALIAAAPVHAEVPDWAPGPAKFAVTPFENHVASGRALDWIIAEAPFELAEKTEAVLGLDPLNEPLYVPGEQVPADPDTVAAYGAKLGAQFVVTGWFDKPGDVLRIDAIVWKIDRGSATVAGEAKQSGPPTSYHQILGDVIEGAWSKAGFTVDVARREQLSRALAKDEYPVFMMGRGLGYMTGAIAAMTGGAGPDLKAADHDLERAVFLDPKLYEAQRLIGELDLATSPPGDPKAEARAAGKFNYATDLAPDDIASLRAASLAAARAGKWEVARDGLVKLVARRPWDLDARYQLGAALWQLGDAKAAERQLVQVTAHAPDHLAARHVLVLIHASRSDTRALIAELEAIAKRAPDDLDVRGDLATAYGAIGEWAKSGDALEQVAAARPEDMAVAVRVGDARRKAGDLKAALSWYAKASRIAPESSLPGFAYAQAEYDAGELAEAARTYTALQKFAFDVPAAWQALGAIAIVQNRADDAAWYLRRAAKAAPRSLITRRALIAAELMRKDSAAAHAQLDVALAAWPDDAQLHYLAGIAYAQDGDRKTARDEQARAIACAPGYAPARSALDALDAGGSPVLAWTPELVRPWGDGEALAAALDQFAAVGAAMAIVRAEYQGQVVHILGALGQGPAATVKPGSVKLCPAGELAVNWAAAQRALAAYERLGVELEAEYRYLARHEDAGLAAALLPNARAALAHAQHDFQLALADVSELRQEWVRGAQAELRVVGCSDRLLAAAAADPSRYHVIEEDRPETVPTQAPPRARPRSTFFVDNTGCPDPVSVWIDGQPIGQVAPGRRSALVADAGAR